MTQKNSIHLPFWVFILIVMILLSACTPQVILESEATKLPVMISYCPTMRPYVEVLLQSQEALIGIQYDSAALAMQALNKGTVHGALIGRIARENEISERTSLLRIADGYTLIARAQGMIRYEDLQKIPILTSTDEADVRNVLPEGTVITYYQDFDKMLSEMNHSVAVLLRWSEVLPTHNLLIPVDEQGLKVPAFRSPHFYFYQDSSVDLSLLFEALDALQ